MQKKFIKELTQQQESEWLEFKENNTNHDQIGQNISAISNSIALINKNHGYIIWGVSNEGQITGTNFDFKTHKVKKQELENYLVTQLDPQIKFTMKKIQIDEKNLIIFQISQTKVYPVKFKKIAYIRNGSYTKKLTDLPVKEQELWKVLDTSLFEESVAKENLNPTEILKLIDYPGYFKKINETLPETHTHILNKLIEGKIILKQNGHDIYSITNLGAILFCNNLNDFPQFVKRHVRVITYKDDSKFYTIREKEFTKGYALDFENIIDYIDSQVPKSQKIGKAFREEISMYPKLAIRELVANALIHQDFNTKGLSLLIEIFKNRLDISNPGIPLININRFIDAFPQSRNEKLTTLMRRIKICEDRGSGIDKVIKEIESYQLPPPSFIVNQNSFIATLYGMKDFSDMDMEERIKACYQHACLQYVLKKTMTNSSLRKRFKLEETQNSSINKIFIAAIKQGFIKKTGTSRWTKYKPIFNINI